MQKPTGNLKFAYETIANMKAKINDLKEEIKKLEQPDMYWDVDNGEDNINDPRDAFENGFSQDTKIGETMTFDTATKRKSETYKLTKLNEDGSFEIELIHN